MQVKRESPSLSFKGNLKSPVVVNLDTSRTFWGSFQVKGAAFLKAFSPRFVLNFGINICKYLTTNHNRFIWHLSKNRDLVGWVEKQIYRWTTSNEKICRPTTMGSLRIKCDYGWDIRPRPSLPAAFSPAAVAHSSLPSHCFSPGYLPAVFCQYCVFTWRMTHHHASM